MSDIADHYRHLAKRFTATVEALPADDDRWAAPTPCPDWTARQLLQHMLDTHHLFFGLINRELPAGPAVDGPGGPLPAWAHVRDQMQAALDDPEVAGTEFDGFAGRTRWDAAVDRFICADLVVHRWDLGHAVGEDGDMEPAEIERIWAMTEAVGDAMRSPGAFGPAVEPPPDATEQERLLAFLGRDPR